MTMFLCSWTILLSLLTVLSCAVFCSTTLRNVTIDDEHGDPIFDYKVTYLPKDGWTQGSLCTGCAAHPDPKHAFEGTWHDATHHPNDTEDRVVSLQFNGTAIYTFFIVPNTLAEGVTTLVNLSFVLDEEHVGNFQHQPTPDTNFDFNVLGYANATLTNGPHQLNIVATGDNASIFLFDYAIYSFDDASTTVTASPVGVSDAPTEITSGVIPIAHKHHPDTALIVGIVLGCVMSLSIVTALVLYCRRKRQREREIADNIQITPYVVRTQPQQTITSYTTDTDLETQISSDVTAANLTPAQLSTRNMRTHEKSAAKLDVPSSHQDTMHQSFASGSTPSQAHADDLERRIEDTESTLVSLSRSLTTSADVGRRRRRRRRNSRSANSAAISEASEETLVLQQRIAELRAELEQMRRRREHLRAIRKIRETLPGYSDVVQEER